MQSLMFLGCFDQKLSKKNLWRVGLTPPPLGTGRVKNPNSVHTNRPLLECIADENNKAVMYTTLLPIERECDF